MVVVSSTVRSQLVLGSVNDQLTLLDPKGTSSENNKTNPLPPNGRSKVITLVNHIIQCLSIECYLLFHEEVSPLPPPQCHCDPVR